VLFDHRWNPFLGEAVTDVSVETCKFVQPAETCKYFIRNVDRAAINVNLYDSGLNLLLIIWDEGTPWRVMHMHHLSNNHVELQPFSLSGLGLYGIETKLSVLYFWPQ
jgi:hypothetical protein